MLRTEHSRAVQYAHRIWRARWAYIFMAPFLLPFVVFVLWPIIAAILSSFQRVGYISRTWVGLANYAAVLTDNISLQAFWNTGVLVVWVVPLETILSLAIAVVVVRLSRRWQSYFRVAFYVPVVASSVILSLIWLWLLNPVYGLFDQFLGIFGVAHVDWLGQVNTALYAVMFVLLSTSLGIPIIVFIAGLNAVPREVLEAAKIDGATWPNELRYVSLPLMRPVIGFILVVTTIGTSQVFAVVELLTKGGPASSTETVVYQIWERAFALNDLGFASALSVLLLLITLVAAVVQVRTLGRVRYD